jgi:hypothetical protein
VTAADFSVRDCRAAPTRLRTRRNRFALESRQTKFSRPRPTNQPSGCRVAEYFRGGRDPPSPDRRASPPRGPKKKTGELDQTRVPTKHAEKCRTCSMAFRART